MANPSQLAPAPELAIRTALANVPSATERAGHLTVPAPKVTVGELRNLKLALEFPRQKPDGVAVAVSGTSAAFFAIKLAADVALRSDKIGIGEIIVSTFALTAALAFVAILAVRYYRESRRVYPFHDAALKELDLLVSRYCRDDWT